MTHKINNLEDLCTVHLKEDDQIDDLVQAFRSICEIQRKEAALRTIEFQTDNILRQNKDALISNDSERIDDARYLAAYVLAFKEQSLDNEREKYTKVFFTLVDLLRQLVPSFNTELETMNRVERDRCSVSKIYFSWNNIVSPFSAEALAGLLLKTKINSKTESDNDQTKEDGINEKAEIEPGTSRISEPDSSKKADSEVATVDKQEKKQDTASQPKVKQSKCVNPSYDFGKEDQYKEFKCTFFDGSYNKNQQPFNICREICAFLNAAGGTIYIGVGDDGKALPMKLNGRPYGVESDIKLCGLSSGDRDVYCLSVKNKIRDILKKNNKIDKFINKLTVSPCRLHDNVVEISVPESKSIIFLQGVAYQRSGSECLKMTQEQIDERRRELNSSSRIEEFKRLLRKAIHEKKQVILRSYRSLNSDTISDRYVEPINFTSDYTRIMCYDNRKNDIRQFVLSRINDVEILESDWINESQHRETDSDLFGWTEQGNKYHISLDLHLSAYDYLREKNPYIKQKNFTRPTNEVWRLDTYVYSLYPVVLFFLDHAEAVTINDTEDSEKLKEEIFRYVNDKVLAKLRSCTDLIPADLTSAQTDETEEKVSVKTPKLKSGFLSLVKEKLNSYLWVR